MREPGTGLPKYTFNWKGVAVMLAGMTLLTLLVAVADAFSIFVFKKDLQYTDGYMVVMNTAGLLGAIVAFDLLVCRPQTRRPLAFDLSRRDAVTMLLIFPMMLGMMLIAEFFTSAIPVTGPYFGKLYEVFSKLMDQLSADTPTMLLMTVGLAPVLEEIIFRGIIQKGLTNKGWQPWKAVLLSATVFGLVHGNPWQLVGAVLLGTVLGTVYYKTGSLLLSILLHAFNNLISCLLILNTKSESIADAVGLPPAVLLGLGIAVFAVFYLIFQKKNPTPLKIDRTTP